MCVVITECKVAETVLSYCDVSVVTPAAVAAAAV